MRFTTVASLLIALIMALAVVVGFQRWMAGSQARMEQELTERLGSDRKAQPEMTIVVAAEAIRFGELIEPIKLREIPWSSDLLPEGSFSKIDDVIVGSGPEEERYALTQISLGEPILNSKITMPGQRAKLSTALSPGYKAVSIRVNDVLGVAGFVLPGDRVDVLITRGRGGEAFVDVLLQGVKILAIDQLVDDRRDSPSVVRTVTVEVDTTQAQKLVLGSNVGTLSLALRNVGSNDVEENDRVTVADLSESEVDQGLFSSGLGKLLQTVEMPQAVEPNPAMESEEVSAPVVGQTFIKRTVSVSVIRNGAVSEYKVKRSDEADAENVVLLPNANTNANVEASPTSNVANP